MNKALLTTKEAAQYLSISTKTLLWLREKGTVEAVRFGAQYRFRPETLDALIQKYEKTGRNLSYE